MSVPHYELYIGGEAFQIARLALAEPMSTPAIKQSLLGATGDDHPLAHAELRLHQHEPTQALERSSARSACFGALTRTHACCALSCTRTCAVLRLLTKDGLQASRRRRKLAAGYQSSIQPRRSALAASQQVTLRMLTRQSSLRMAHSPSGP